MEYKYKLAKLQYDKEKIEELMTRQTRRVGLTFPQKLELEFWTLHLDRAQTNISQSFWVGVLTYFILIMLIVPGDYWIIDKQFFAHDFIHCLLSLLNGAVSLLLLYAFAQHTKLKAYFSQASLFIVFWLVISMTWLTMTVYTEALKHQAMMIICMIYILGYIITGVKPMHMLMTGLLAATVSMSLLFSMSIHFDAMVVGRVLVGSCTLGFAISKMLCARERMIFLNMLRADISEQIHRIHTTELLHLSQHDELTKISNRRTFDEMLNNFYDQSRRNTSSLAVLFIDVDHFKNYNDFYGHQKGDGVISAIAETIKNAIRHMDFVARYGGEEFVVLLPETDAHGAYAVASDIYKAIDRLEIPHAKSLVSNHVTISLGITVYRAEDVSKEELLTVADQALYRAKQLGRNQIYYQSIRSAHVA